MCALWWYTNIYLLLSTLIHTTTNHRFTLNSFSIKSWLVGLVKMSQKLNYKMVSVCPNPVLSHDPAVTRAPGQVSRPSPGLQLTFRHQRFAPLFMWLPHLIIINEKKYELKYFIWTCFWHQFKVASGHKASFLLRYSECQNDVNPVTSQQIEMVNRKVDFLSHY